MEMDHKSQEVQRIRISVRNLVEFILRSGDIDNRYGSLGEKEAMQEGSRIHRKLQGRMGSNYRAEVALSQDIACDGFVLTVEGRADGIFTETGEENCIFIDEIKGIYRELKYLTGPIPVHLAQAKCYAYIYAVQRDLKEIGVQMTYCNLETEEIRRFREIYSFDELCMWFESLIGQYRKWAEYQIKWKEMCRSSIKQVEFPFSWRPGQKDVSAGVYRTILRKKKLFIQAPTGTGKTISTVFPAVKAVGEGLADRIFYMTAKTITRTVAEDAFAILREQGLRMKVLTLTAKEKICFCEETECNPVNCPYAKGHYDRVNEAIFEMITTTDRFSREVIMAQAEKWMVCPFEFSLDLSLWTDAIICDYNYVFDPRARLKRFFGEGVRGEYLFLIDEAHNLVERGREMFSASLYKEDFLELKKAVRPYSKKMTRALERCNKYLLELKREAGEGKNPCRVLEDVGIFPVHLTNLCGIIENFLEELRSGKRQNHRYLEDRESGQMQITGMLLPAEGTEAGQASVQGEAGDFRKAHQKILDLYFQVRAFLDTCDRLDHNYVIYTELCEDGRFMIRLYCVDISKNLQECLDKGRSTIYFSATLLPVTYYKSLLSTIEDDYAIYAHSSFDPGKKQVLIGTDTSSRYTNRTIQEYQKMARYVLETVRARQGNYMVFFSSYRMMEEVANAFRDLCRENGVSVRSLWGKGKSEDTSHENGDVDLLDEEEVRLLLPGREMAVQTEENVIHKTGPVGPQMEIELICQMTGMNESAREAFLEKFKEERNGSLIGFCVMGGIFGEGIDLKHDRLIGAVIVGTGLPQVCNEREILKKFYDDRGEDGFFYAYLCPGMNKVLQSAGRVIRTDEDEGVILLLDERFVAARYRRMFPAEWENPQTCTVASVREKTERFWKGRAVNAAEEAFPEGKVSQ